MSEDTRMVVVNGHSIGMIGLQQVFEEIKSLGMPDEEDIKRELIGRAKKRNYIPPSAESKYAVALLDEYKRFLATGGKGRSGLEVTILGPGCPRCDELEKEVTSVLADLGVVAHVEHVRDVSKFKDYGVFGTPALIMNGEVKSVGRVPLRREITLWVKTHEA